MSWEKSAYRACAHAGDVVTTYADVSELERDFGFAPNTTLDEGLERFTHWYLNEYRR